MGVSRPQWGVAWPHLKWHDLSGCGMFITLRAHAHRGVKLSVVGGGIVNINLRVFWNQSYFSKYSLSELYFNTDRLLIEFNGLWYSLAARQVFVAIANPYSLSFL